MPEHSIPDQFRLDGKTAMVTGVGAGIGSHSARAFAEVGANVVLVARSADRMQVVADAISERGGQCLALPCDIGTTAGVQRAVSAAQDRFGSVDVLFHVAAGGMHRVVPGEDLLSEPDDYWEEATNVNLLAPLRLTRALLPDMRRKGGGSIILTLATSGFVVVPTSVLAYHCTKAAMAMLLRYLARECGPEVRVNGVCPGPIFADPSEEMLAVLNPLMDRTPLKRIGTPQEAVGAAIFLASDASSYTTGTVIFLDGGRVNVNS